MIKIFRLWPVVILFACGQDVTDNEPDSDFRIDVVASDSMIAPGETVQLQPVFTDLAGNSMPARSVTWSFAPVGIVTINANGAAVAVSSGTAKVTAALNAVSGELDLVVLPARSETFLMVSGPQEEPVLRGRTIRRTLADEPFKIRVGPFGNGRGTILIDLLSGFYLMLSAPFGEELKPGTYRNVQRSQAMMGVPGMDLVVESYGCSRVTGEFTIHEIEFGRYQNIDQVDRLRATFVRGSCDGWQIPVTGEIRIAGPVYRY